VERAPLRDERGIAPIEGDMPMRSSDMAVPREDGPQRGNS
jgi:hypothetical protein